MCVDLSYITSLFKNIIRNIGMVLLLLFVNVVSYLLLLLLHLILTMFCWHLLMLFLFVVVAVALVLDDVCVFSVICWSCFLFFVVDVALALIDAFVFVVICWWCLFFVVVIALALDNVYVVASDELDLKMSLFMFFGTFWSSLLFNDGGFRCSCCCLL